MQLTRLKRLFTDTDMHSPEFRGAIEVTYRHLQKILPAERIPSKNYDLVLDMHEEGGEMQWFYYYACHKKRCLFWLEAYDAKDMISEVYWVASAAHVSASPILSSTRCLFQPVIRFTEHRLEALYWYTRYAEFDLN
jgi:predicted deacylase